MDTEVLHNTVTTRSPMHYLANSVIVFGLVVYCVAGSTYVRFTDVSGGPFLNTETPNLLNATPDSLRLKHEYLWEIDSNGLLGGVFAQNTD